MFELTTVTSFPTKSEALQNPNFASHDKPNVIKRTFSNTRYQVLGMFLAVAVISGLIGNAYYNSTKIQTQEIETTQLLSWPWQWTWPWSSSASTAPAATGKLLLNEEIETTQLITWPWQWSFWPWNSASAAPAAAPSSKILLNDEGSVTDSLNRLNQHEIGALILTFEDEESVSITEGPNGISLDDVTDHLVDDKYQILWIVLPDASGNDNLYLVFIGDQDPDAAFDSLALPEDLVEGLQGLFNGENHNVLFVESKDEVTLENIWENSQLATTENWVWPWQWSFLPWNKAAASSTDSSSSSSSSSQPAASSAPASSSSSQPAASSSSSSQPAASSSGSSTTAKPAATKLWSLDDLTAAASNIANNAVNQAVADAQKKATDAALAALGVPQPKGDEGAEADDEAVVAVQQLHGFDDDEEDEDDFRLDADFDDFFSDLASDNDDVAVQQMYSDDDDDLILDDGLAIDADFDDLFSDLASDNDDVVAVQQLHGFDDEEDEDDFRLDADFDDFFSDLASDNDDV